MNAAANDLWVEWLVWLITGVSLTTPQLRSFARPALEAQGLITYHREVRLLQDEWSVLAEQIPDGLNERGWREVHQVVGIAIANVCFSPDHAEWRSVRNLRKELAEQIEHAEKPSLETAEAMWTSLSKTGPHGEEYIERMQPLFDEAMKFAQQ